ncbi:MAG: S-layer homology domain-containing protein [Candidatus Cohnella colombiensis]|uniref:S-layer homology domain-containing protein n=1 Tax=Candidatus Cohnella colombiensis TaxID=3121368 RepID=A0AA95F4K0_9BACL|nr:MAG: S-layer homology domain-containing protein [Cohnella sp.]
MKKRALIYLLSVLLIFSMNTTAFAEVEFTPGGANGTINTTLNNGGESTVTDIPLGVVGLTMNISAGGADLDVRLFDLDANKYIVAYDANGNAIDLSPTEGNSGKEITFTYKGMDINYTGYGGTAESITITGATTVRLQIRVAAFANGTGTGTYSYSDYVPSYKVTYNGNGSTGGTVPVDNGVYAVGAQVTVKGNEGNLVNAGSQFVGWNDNALGNGTFYTANSTLAMGSANVVLYAIWYNNAAPTVSSVTVTGTAQVGEHLTGSYTYNDSDSDLEGISVFKWYRADDAAGTNKTAIAGATGTTYTLMAADLGKRISFEVKPVAQTGITTGTAVESSRTSAVIPAEAAPVASNVAVTGTAQVGETLTGSYTYSDVNGDAQGTSTFKWYRADDSAGTNKIAIAGAIGTTYTLTIADLGKHISFEVTPIANKAPTTGVAVESSRTLAVIPAEAAPVASNVTVTGTAQVGETLTGSYTYSDVNGDAQGTSTFKWYRADDAAGTNKTAIAGATGTTYTLAVADLGKHISFEVTPVANKAPTTGVAVESGRTSAVIPAEAAPVASNVTVTGTAQVGETLTGSYTYSDVNNDTEATSTFKWYRADDVAGTNKTAIAGATGTTYTLTIADLGKHISFEVTPVANKAPTTGAAVESSRTSAVILAEAAPVASNVTVTGTAQVGETLTGSYTYSDVNGDAQGTSTFKWYRADDTAGTNKTAIAGATGTTYTLAVADLGKHISFEVTPIANKAPTTGTAVESSRTLAVIPAEAAPVASNVTVTGTAQVGETLTGNYTYSDVNGDAQGTSTFKWYRADDAAGTNKTAIAGATGTTYTLAVADLGKHISFEVTPVANKAPTTGVAVESSRTSAVIPAEAVPVASNVTVTGTAQVGETLTGSYTYSDVNNDTEATSTFKWYRADDAAGTNKAAIAGATGTTYTLTVADLGKHISFEVTPVANKAPTTGVAVESGRTSAVIPAEAAPVASNVTVTGTAQVGETLTGSYTYSDVNNDTEATSTFKWYRADDVAGTNKTAIAGATGTTYTVQEADLGKFISFEVTPVANKAPTTGVAVESSRTSVVIPAEAVPVASNVTVTGTAQVGETLTGNYTYSDVNGDAQGTSTFKWYRADDAAGTNKTAIAGATGTSYTLTSHDLGKHVSFEVTPIANKAPTTGSVIESSRTLAVIPAEAAPAASNVTVTGTTLIGQTLTGSYAYSDVNGDAEGTSTFKWYRSDDAAGTNKVEITGATGTTYTLQAADIGKHISFEVTPVANKAPVTGVAIESIRTSAVTTPVSVVIPPKDTGVIVLVNGKAESTGTASTKELNGQKVTSVVVDEQKLQERLDAAGDHAVITIPVSSDSDVVIGELNGRMIKNMESMQAILELRTEQGSYKLPAGQINIDAISEQFGKEIDLKDITIRIEIAEPAANTLQVVDNAATNRGFTLVVPPLNFKVVAVNGNREVEVSKFSAYVERTVAIPSDIDATRITTGIVVEPDGTIRHVPTKVVNIDGTYYAIINSLTNSTYSVVWHPITFKDVENHWAKDAVNEMGSRMVINGTAIDLFSPDRDITRAEFAAIVVRSLGLRLENGESSFKDVKSTDWYSSAIQTAYSYGLIRGYEDGTFRPLNSITREEAMVIIAKAMKLTGLKEKLSVQATGQLIDTYKDAEEVSTWALSSIADALKAGIMTGRGQATLAPKATITRAEVAIIVQRLLQNSDLI